MKKAIKSGLLFLVAIFLFNSSVLADILSGSSTTNTSNDISLTQLTLNTPSGVVAGDVLLASVSVNGGTSAGITAPQGWTLIARTNNDTNIAIATYYKVAGVNEASTQTWTIAPQTRAVGGMTRYSGVDVSNPISTFASTTGRGTTATAPSVTATANDKVIHLFASDAGTNNSPYFSTTTSEVKEYDAKNTPFGPTTGVESFVKTSAGATGASTVTISQGPQRDWVAQTVTLRTASIADGFESYSPNTSLHGQNGGTAWATPWSGSTQFLVENSVVAEGSKAVQLHYLGSGEPAISRTFSPKVSGTIHFVMGKDSASQAPQIIVYSGSTYAMIVDIGDPDQQGLFWQVRDGNTYVNLQPYVLGSLDYVDIQFDSTNQRYRVSINNGAFSSWAQYANSVSSIDRLELQLSQVSSAVMNAYWDDVRINQ